jgi:hypothetical protein
MEQEDANLLCDYCGIVFAKHHPEAGPAAPESTGVPAGARYAAAASGVAAEESFKVYEPRSRRVAAWLRERLLCVQPVASPLALGWRAALLALLSIWGVRLVLSTIESNGAGESFLHLVNLPFHEAGHVFFTPFGDFVRTLGGTLGQLIMPMVCCLTLLLKTRDPFGAGAALWWFGENFLDIAPYIDDAGTGELPLLGGNTGESTPYGFHDWEYLLTETNRLGHEHEMARASHAFGTCVMAFAVAWMTLTLWRSYRAGRVSRTGAATDLSKAA